ncbi:MAG: rod shape-determining protein MreC [Phycisphaerales bacterium]
MARSAHQSGRWLIASSIGLLTLSLLPARWLWWLNDIAAIVNLPLAPLADVSNDLRTWLRRGDDPLAGSSELEQTLVADRDRYRALWNDERLRNEELVRQLDDVRLAEQLDEGAMFDPVRADVVGRGPDSLRGAVRLNIGTRSGVAPGDVAVFRGAHLVGRVADDPDALSCLLVSTTDPSVGRIHAAVAPDPEPADPRPATIPLLLTPVGDGTFVADAGRDARIRIGDEVVCADPSWKSTARGMIIGVVDSIDRRDDQPLRNRLRIKPIYEAQRLATVIVKVASPAGRTREAGDRGVGARPPGDRGGAP